MPLHSSPPQNSDIFAAKARERAAQVLKIRAAHAGLMKDEPEPLKSRVVGFVRKYPTIILMTITMLLMMGTIISQHTKNNAANNLRGNGLSETFDTFDEEEISTSTYSPEEFDGTSTSTSPPEELDGTSTSTSPPEELDGTSTSTSPPEELDGTSTSTSPPEESEEEEEDEEIEEEEVDEQLSLSEEIEEDEVDEQLSFPEEIEENEEVESSSIGLRW